MSQALPTLAIPHTCRLCKQSHLKVLGQKRSSYSNMLFELLECQSCAFQFVTPVVDPQSVYTSSYYEGKGVDPLVDYNEEFNSPFDGARFHEFDDILKIVKGFKKATDEKIQWLDFGCGSGALLKFLAEQKSVPVAPSGFDESEPSKNLKNLGLDIFDRGQMDGLAGKYDVVTCLEVIEHVVFPKEVIHSISKLLKPGGLLFLTTGNMNSPVAKMKGFDFSYCVPEIHISLFTPAVLSQLYGEFGLKPVHFRYRGIIKFKILKNLGPRLSKIKLLTLLAGTRPVTWFFDWLFGVSKIPCAVKTPWHNDGNERKS